MRNLRLIAFLCVSLSFGLRAQTQYSGEYRFKKDKNNTCTIIVAQFGNDVSYRVEALRDGKLRSFSGQTVISKKGVAKAYLSDRKKGAYARLVFTKRNLKVRFCRSVVGHYKWLRFNGLYKKNLKDTPEEMVKDVLK